MRYYDIQAGSLSYTSLGGLGSNPSALNIECDISIDAGDVVHSGSSVRIWGIGLEDISQARKLFNQPFKMSGGMAAGLPLANPSQAGPLLANAIIIQAFGNWIGTDQTLDLIISAGSPGPTTGGINQPQPPTPLVLNWKKGQDLAPALQQALQQAFPSMSVDMKIGKYTAAEDQPHFAQNIKNFGYFIRRMSQDIKGANAQGVSITMNNGKISVTDGSQSQAAGTLNYQDLIGQPTWIGQNRIQIKTVMRGDMHVDGMITLPQTVVTNTAGAGYTSAGTAGGYDNSLTFQGTFKIASIRHVGNFRQPDAASWVTIIEATTDGGA